MVGLHWEKGRKEKRRNTPSRLMPYDLTLPDICCFIILAVSSSWLPRFFTSPLMLSSSVLFPFLLDLLRVNVYRLGCRWKEMGNEAALALVHTRTSYAHFTQRNAIHRFSLVAGSPS